MRSRLTASLSVLLLAGAGPAAAIEPDNVRLARKHYQDGVALMRPESWDAAAEKFQAAVAADPRMVLAHYNLGQTRMAQKRYPDAVEAYSACKQSFLALSSLSQKERAERDRERRDEIRELRDSLERLHTLKNASEMQLVTQIEDRIRLLDSMDLKDHGQPSMPAELPLALGSAYFRQGQMDAAEREYREAARLNPRLGAAHNNLAVICLMSGRAQEASAELSLAEKSGFKVNPKLKQDVEAAAAKAER